MKTSRESLEKQLAANLRRFGHVVKDLEQSAQLSPAAWARLEKIVPALAEALANVMERGKTKELAS